ncbi:hypothetical protein UY3_17917 [Chelonia mydas]|uniref:Uncharacterized protein n=1 Tax=Chelonia mydas TaxID=8469 RepID=M7AIX2_CHEMY|nr:hypothetical protein UY3_17917 [Chelonia mydas]
MWGQMPQTHYDTCSLKDKRFILMIARVTIATAKKGGATTTTPSLSVDSSDGVLSAMPEDFAEGEVEEEDELEESTQHTVLPDSQDLFITLTEIPSQPNQAGEGTSGQDIGNTSLQGGALTENMSIIEEKPLFWDVKEEPPSHHHPPAAMGTATWALLPLLLQAEEGHPGTLPPVLRYSLDQLPGAT